MAVEARVRSHGLRLFVAAAAVFAWLVPLAPGFGDSAEVGAAAQTLGVAHPTGFPLDVLALRLGAYVPLGSISFRQNIVVALVSAAVLATLAEVTRRLSLRLGVAASSAAVGGLVAALGLGTWATFLGTALTVEVYSTAALLVTLGALELTRHRPRIAVLGVLGGLALSAHISACVGLLPLVLALLLARGRARVPRRLGALALCAFLVGGLLLYLPLASRADPALDWGDPETLGRFWGHLSAERIRSAYAGAMLGANGRAMGQLLGQLAELSWLMVPALFGLRALRSLERRAALMLLTVFTLDLAYASFINPMGIVDRQVGHVAGAALCAAAGVGVADMLGRVERTPLARRAALGLVAILAILAVLSAPSTLAEDGSAEAESVGSGGPLVELPPRAVFVCRSDDVCAGALFARYAEWTRPDMAVVVGQHLWEPAERRRLGQDFPSIVAFGARRPAADGRAALAQRAVAVLARPQAPRPVFFEAAPVGAPAGQFVAAGRPPFLVRAESAYVGFPPERVLVRFDAQLAARLGRHAPRHPLARSAYSQEAGRVGKGLLALGSPALAAEAFERAIALDPSRAAARTNLGVAREAAGDLQAALEATTEALRLDPTRALAWLNMTRFRASMGDLDAARATLRHARDAGVWDARFDQLAAAIEAARRGRPPP